MGAQVWQQGVISSSILVLLVVPLQVVLLLLHL
jgi:hypothetical protein